MSMMTPGKALGSIGKGFLYFFIVGLLVLILLAVAMAINMGLVYLAYLSVLAFQAGYVFWGCVWGGIVLLIINSITAIARRNS